MADDELVDDLAQDVRLEISRSARGCGVKNHPWAFAALARTIAWRVLLKKAPMYFEFACLQAPANDNNLLAGEVVGEACARPEAPCADDPRAALRRLLTDLEALRLTRQERVDFEAWLTGSDSREIAAASGRRYRAVDTSISKALSKARRWLSERFSVRLDELNVR